MDDFITDAISNACSAAGISAGTQLTGVVLHEFINREHAEQVVCMIVVMCSQLQVDALRKCLHVLFSFVRKDYSDSSIRFELAQKLERVASVCVAVGTADALDDVINHVIRF